MKPFSFLLLLSGLASAQVYTPPPAPTPPPATNDTAIIRPKEEKPKSPYGEELPMLDPAAETLTIGGVSIPLGDNRVLKARFEKYLSQPPEDNEAAIEYRANIKEILDTISPLRPGGPKLHDAFKLLPRAGAYPGDANICSSLAEAIYVAMLAKKDINGLKALNDSIEQEKQAVASKADFIARKDKDVELKTQKTKNGGSTTTRETADGTGTKSIQYANQLKRIAEIEALKKANIARTEAQTIQTKTQYQVNMVQWFIQRRYEHVLMASRFYNQIWKDGDSALRIQKDSDVAKLFSQSVGMSPTVSSLDSLSSEAIREVDKYIAAFDLMLSRNELHSASQRLMEAYALGEYLNPVATLPLEKKQRVASYVRDLHELYGTLQARDYTKAKELADRLKANARDFPSSKVDSAISAYTLASDLSIEEAKAQLLAKNSDKAAEKIKAATEIWPTNPRLSEFRSMMGNASPLVQARNDFDRLLAEKNFREIATRQYELAPAIQGDATRENAFKQILTNLKTIEAAIGKAAEFTKMGQEEAAWEQLAEIRETFPDDPKLGREIELLAPQVADFTRALDRAKQFENRTPKQTGTALSWYLKARSIFPLSKFADEGIKRVLDDILPEDTK
jgi:tetratricopeptide (TPR) repeat protein